MIIFNTNGADKLNQIINPANLINNICEKGFNFIWGS